MGSQNQSRLPAKFLELFIRFSTGMETEKIDTSTMKLILASASPRRAEILRNAGFTFEIFPADVDETILADEAAEDYVRRLAEEKSRAALERLRSNAVGAIAIGADTTVVAAGKILGKPADEEDARRMLRLLSGQTHRVLTGIAVIRSTDGRAASHVETTRVTFARLSESEIEEYLASREPFDKAGGYGIQGIGGRYVTRIEGCYFNVMGLPLSSLWTMLRGLGWKDSVKS
jgi:septum formation protein